MSEPQAAKGARAPHLAEAGDVLPGQAGEPVVGVDVRALRRSFGGGQLKFIPINTSISSARTDDRGAFRIATIRPGDYVVAVASSQTTMPATVFDQNLWQRNEEVMSAIPEFQIRGYSQNQQIGDVVRRGAQPHPGSPESRERSGSGVDRHVLALRVAPVAA